MLLTVYIIIDIIPEIKNNYQEKLDNASAQGFKNGTSYGQTATILYIFEEVAQCKQLPITNLQNQTINLVAVECLFEAGDKLI